MYACCCYKGLRIGPFEGHLVTMMRQTAKVVPIRSTDSHIEEVVSLAFAYWRETFGVRNSSPADDLFRAHQELRGGWTGGPRLFLVRTPRS